MRKQELLKAAERDQGYESVGESSRTSQQDQESPLPCLSSTAKVTTPGSKGKSRTKYMKQYRAKFSHQKKNTLKSLDRKRKAPPMEEGELSGKKTSKRKALLPETPERYAKKMRSLIDEATPKKKAAMKEISIIPDEKERQVSSL